MTDILKLIQQRQSTRVAYDPNRPLAKEDLRQIIEAARWAPTAHNMQNFEILVVDDKEVLEKIGNIKSQVSEAFIRENYQQLSFSEEELLQKKVGILGTVFPPDWRDPARLDKAVRESRPTALKQRINGSPVLLIVVYDARKRAPASEGDVLGFISLGCVMENMWLMAQSLGFSVHVLSAFAGDAVEKEVKQILSIPEYMKVAFAFRMGHPVSKPAKCLRMRRDVEMFTYHNRFENKGFG
ncbi:MAG: nitroreductase family protein [Candidatus Bathyarchaeia archaeon]|jgi:nitroreductase